MGGNYWEMLWGWKTGPRLVSVDLGELLNRGVSGDPSPKLSGRYQDK